MRGGIRKRRTTVRIAVIVATVMGLALSMVPSAQVANAAADPSEQFLFTVEAGSGTTVPARGRQAWDETFTLRLTGVEPVTQFADRPFRDARLISPQALVTHWSTWFAADPPNAVLTFSRAGQAPGSFVVGLTRPRYDPRTRTLSFTAFRERRQHDPAETGSGWRRQTTPSNFTDASLFIDDAAADTTPPTLTPGSCDWDVDTSTMTYTLTVPFTVNDAGGVASIGYLVASAPYNVGQIPPQLTASTSTSRSYTAVFPYRWNGLGGLMTVSLSSATDTAGNVASNLAICSFSMGIA